MVLKYLVDKHDFFYRNRHSVSQRYDRRIIAVEMVRIRRMGKRARSLVKIERVELKEKELALQVKLKGLEVRATYWKFLCPLKAPAPFYLMLAST